MKKLYFYLSVLTLFLSSMTSWAQTKYGDGTLLLRSNFIMLWDGNSSSMIPTDSNIYSYNSMGLSTRVFKNSFDIGNQTWTPEYIRIQDYDANGNITLYVDSFLLMSKFDDRYKETYTYNAKNEQVTSIQSYWNKSKGNWLFDERSTSTYTPTGNESMDLREKYVDSSKGWVNALRRVYTYNSSDQLEFYDRELWNNNSKQWESDYRVLSFSDKSGIVDSTIYQAYNKNTTSWVNDLRHRYTRNEAGKLLTSTLHKWVNNAWQPTEIATYTYMPDGQMQSYMQELWDNSKMALRPYYKMGYEYNGSGWLIKDSVYMWDAAANQWNLYRRNFAQYNINGYQTIFYSDIFNKATSKWNAYTEVRFRYIAKATNKMLPDQRASLSVLLFPNPAKNGFQILSDKVFSESMKVNLCDVKGVPVDLPKERIRQNGNIISVNLEESVLPRGLYYIEIFGENKRTSLPLLLE